MLTLQCSSMAPRGLPGRHTFPLLQFNQVFGSERTRPNLRHVPNKRANGGALSP